MNLQELDAALPVVQGALTLTTTSLGGLLRPFLTMTYGSSPLVIGGRDGATKRLTAGAVVVEGTAPLLNVADAPVQAVFTLQVDGGVVAMITWTLPAAWKFATSFPALPVFEDAQSMTPASSILDQIVRGESAFVVSTAPGVDPATGAALSAGLNVVAAIRPSGVFGLF